MKSEQARKDRSREQAKTSMTGNDRMTENADLGDTGISGSTTGDSAINFGMGEEGVPATGNVLGVEESALAHGGGSSRQHRSAMQRSSGSNQNSKKQHNKQKQSDDGGGSRQVRSGG